MAPSLEGEATEKNSGMEQIYRVKRYVSSNGRTILIGKHVEIPNGGLTFWRRNCFQILAHPVFKM